MKVNHQTLNERLGDRLPPEINAGYTIISRADAGEDVVFKLGYNSGAVQPYVTWQSTRSEPIRYDWGHYWSSKDMAEMDLNLRADSERRGVPYDYTELRETLKGAADQPEPSGNPIEAYCAMRRGEDTPHSGVKPAEDIDF